MGKRTAPPDLVRELLSYDSETGIFVWRKNGLLAGGINRAGRRVIGMGRYQVFASVLAWIYMRGEHPPGEIDHINRNRSDDRWSNLRLATRSQNQANTRLYRNNGLKVRGVHKVSPSRYRAMISRDGKNYHLGYFPTLDEASDAWKVAARAQHGQFAAV